MGLKGTLRDDHIARNKFQFTVDGLGVTLTPISIGELAEELDTVDLPDRTRASGGNTKATTTTITLPMHHDDEISAMEAWNLEGKDPVTPTYKKNATLTAFSVSGNRVKSWALEGVFVTNRAIPGFDMTNDGEQANIGFNLSIDEIIPLT